MREQSILFVGNLVGVKAPERVVASFAKVAGRRPGLLLDIVGDGRLKKKLQKQIVQLGVDNRVTLHGRQLPDKVADMMRAASCLCLTSRSEGMPNVVVEALACGTPVVATAVGEVPYLIRDGVNGLVVGRSNTEQGMLNGVKEERTRNQESADDKLIEMLAAALERALDIEWDPQAIAETVAGFTWEAAAQVVVDVITAADESSEHEQPERRTT